MKQNENKNFYDVKKISVSNIKLWLNNPRLKDGPLESEVDCIEAIINNDSKGLLNLAESIARIPWFPEPIILHKFDDKAWTV